MLSWIGWLATAVFAVSYLFKNPSRLRVVQALAALMWIAYGVAIHALPVVVSNVIVAAAAVISAFRNSKAGSVALAEERQ